LTLFFKKGFQNKIKTKRVFKTLAKMAIWPKGQKKKGG
jgi:hypothetical protein